MIQGIIWMVKNVFCGCKGKNATKNFRGFGCNVKFAAKILQKNYFVSIMLGDFGNFLGKTYFCG